MNMTGNTSNQFTKRRKIVVGTGIASARRRSLSEPIVISSSEPEENAVSDNSITEILPPPRPTRGFLPRTQRNPDARSNTVDLTGADTSDDSPIDQGSSDSEILVISEFSRNHPAPVIPRPPPGARPAVARTASSSIQNGAGGGNIVYGTLCGYNAKGPRAVKSPDALNRTIRNGVVSANVQPRDRFSTKLFLAEPNGQVIGYIEKKDCDLLFKLMQQPGVRLETTMSPYDQAEAVDTTGSDMVPIPFFVTLSGPRSKRSQVLYLVKQVDSRKLLPAKPHKSLPAALVKGGPGTSPVPRSQVLAQSSNFTSNAPKPVRAEDIASMFDSLDAGKEWPEKEQDEMVVTPLIKHQKQGLYFMTAREKEKQYTGDIEDENAELWKKRENVHGEDVYLHAITKEVAWAKPNSVRGGLLADMMGLGKTIQILSLIASTKRESEEFARSEHVEVESEDPGHRFFSTQNTRATLVICPTSVISNWEEQILAHIKPHGLKVYVWGRGAETRRRYDPSVLVDHDVVFASYGAVRAAFDQRTSPFHDVRWFRVVLDEAHMIRNYRTKTAIAVFSLDAERRWALSGTPIQNKLNDLFSLIKFLRVDPFQDHAVWKRHILQPMTNGTPYALARIRLLVNSVTLRRLKDKIDLPHGRVDKIVEVELTPMEQEIHDLLLAASQSRIHEMEEAGIAAFEQRIHIITMMLRMRLVSCHGRELLGDQDEWAKAVIAKKGAVTELDSDSSSLTLGSSLSPAKAHRFFNLLADTGANRCQYCEALITPPTLDADEEDAGSSDNEEPIGPAGAKRKRNISKTKKSPKDAKEDTIGHMTPCTHLLCDDCLPVYTAAVATPFTPGMRAHCPICKVFNKMTILPLRAAELKKHAPDAVVPVSKKTVTYRGPSSKVKALIADLLENRAKSTEKDPIRSVVFTSWTGHIDLIEIALKKAGIRWVRLDGSMRPVHRANVIKEFRSDTGIEVFLISITAGGLGLNLTDACRCYIMEPQFNPAVEAQALDRIHRLGQEREVVCVRYIAKNSFEEKVVKLQQKKLDLANMALAGEKLSRDEQIGKLEELKGLFTRDLRR